MRRLQARKPPLVGAIRWAGGRKGEHRPLHRLIPLGPWVLLREHEEELALLLTLGLQFAPAPLAFGVYRALRLVPLSLAQGYALLLPRRNARR